FAHVEDADEAKARRAFDAGAATLNAGQLRFLGRDALPLKGLDKAVDRLEALDPLLKPRVLKACATCVMYDGKLTIRASELLRTLASCLDSPMPLLGDRI